MIKFVEGLNWISILGILIAVETQIGNGSMSITNSFPAAWIPAIKEWMANLATVGGIIVATGAWGRVPASQVSAAPPVAKIIAIVAVLLSCLFAFAGNAHAQGALALRKPAVTGDVKKDIETDFGLNQGKVQITGNPDKDLMALWQKIVAASNADLTYASALAGNANTNASKTRKQCWDAIIALNQQANGVNLKDSTGNALTKPDPHLFTDVEIFAEVVDNLSPQGPLFTSCAGAAQLAKTNTLTFINAVVTGAAGIAALPAGL